MTTACGPREGERGRVIGAGTGPRRLARLARRSPEITLGIGVACWLVLLLVLARDIWFFGDDWDFLFRRGTVPGESRGWLAPHSSHWVLGQVVAYRALFAVFGMHTYLPYALLTIVLHLAISVVSFVVVRRAGARPWIATAAAMLLLFVGVGGETQLYSSAMNHTASLLCGTLALAWLVGRPDWRSRDLAVVVALLAAAVANSGTGLSVVVLVATFVCLRHGLRAAAQVLIPPAVLFLIWFLAWGRSENPSLLSTDSVLALPTFVWTGLTQGLTDASGIPGTGPLAVAGLVAVASMAPDVPEPLRGIAWAGIGAAVAQLALVGLTRSVFGADVGAQGHYAYITVVYLLPAVALCLDVLVTRTAGPPWPPAVAASVVLLGYALHGAGVLHTFSEQQAAKSGVMRERLVAMIDTVDDDQAVLTTTYDDFVNAYLDPRVVASSEIREAMPEGASTSVQARVDVEAMFNIDLRTRAHGLSGDGVVRLASGFERTGLLVAGCTDIESVVGNATLDVEVGDGDGVEIVVTSDATTVRAAVVRDGAFAERTWDVEPGSVYVASTAKGALLNLTFDKPGAYTICHD